MKKEPAFLPDSPVPLYGNARVVVERDRRIQMRRQCLRYFFAHQAFPPLVQHIPDLDFQSLIGA